ncbi:MAG: site-specific DNA-methyltransferase, partial [Actinomycetota bacterium]
MSERDRQTRTSSFGVGRREGHDSSSFYQRFSPPQISDDETVNRPEELITELGSGRLYHGSIDQLQVLPENSVALVVTSPPYFVGKEYELAVTGSNDIPETYFEFLEMLRGVFAECYRILEPGGRIAVNVANLGRKPYRSLSADIINLLQDDLGMLLRGEVIWEKASVSSGSCAWGSFAKASNPVLRDMTERVIIASKGRFSRALTLKKRRALGLPHESSLANDEFVDVTRDVWRIDPESATRIGHPAPFPIELPRRLIDLYTYRGDLVVDPFVGSGTTLVAAARTGRIGIGFDTDKRYLDLSEQRLNDELARASEREELLGTFGGASPVVQSEVVDGLSFEDRQEHFQTMAVAEGRKVQDIARRILEEAGFTKIKEKPKHPGGVIDFSFQATHPGDGSRWWIDVPGAFTTNRPGLQRIDAVWKLLGRLSVLGLSTTGDQAEGSQTDRVLVLTASLPKPGSPGDKALRAVGPGVIFDAVEVYDPAAVARLTTYAGT